jgi:hypothetical protein
MILPNRLLAGLKTAWNYPKPCSVNDRRKILF